ncbi:MAG: hypothetical protein V4736_07585, partial [Bdellovibrionota bacterium]
MKKMWTTTIILVALVGFSCAEQKKDRGLPGTKVKSENVNETPEQKAKREQAEAAAKQAAADAANNPNGPSAPPADGQVPPVTTPGATTPPA